MSDLSLPAADLADIPVPPSPGPVVGETLGRPRSPGSGRTKGSKNKVGREARALAGKYSLRAFKHLWRLVAQDADPGLKLKALELLLGYAHGRPAATVLLGGDGGDPIKTRQEQELMANPKELARRLALLLTIGDPSIRKITDADRAASHAQDFEGSLAGPPVEADASNGAAGDSRTLADAITVPEGAEDPGGVEDSVEQAGGPGEPVEPRPPSEGREISFGQVSITCDGPMRPGLPPVYSTKRNGLGIHHGTWVACLALARQIVGDPLPKGRLTETRPDSAVLRPSLTREQRSTERGIHP
jgi:hypothetical protein